MPIIVDENQRSIYVQETSEKPANKRAEQPIVPEVEVVEQVVEPNQPSLGIDLSQKQILKVNPCGRPTRAAARVALV